MRTRICGLFGLVPLLLIGCGHKLGYRHFAGPLLPVADLDRSAEYAIGDDRSITFSKDRLELTLLPLTVEMLNRQFASRSKVSEGFVGANPYDTATNPYTYGDWKPPGEESVPTRFTVFLLKVKNYAYPKVGLNPSFIELVATNGRHYQSLSLLALTEYYWPYAVAYSGNARSNFTERRDLMDRTLFPNEMIFSGQEREGFIVFPDLDLDIEEFTVWIRGIGLRYDYRDEPIESVDIPYTFQREVYYARHPRSEEG